ncbi:MAG: hypothetical protein H6907_12405 [Hyphomicrobiales bacterium]|nr:hypothetical protein [Hyphomicrobiales bacterium]
MFGLSLTKILFTIIAVAAIWYGFKWLNRVQDNRDARPRGRVNGGGRPKARGGPSRAAPEAADPDVEDMVACPTCGDFVTARGARSCGRDNCPYPG